MRESIICGVISQGSQTIAFAAPAATAFRKYLRLIIIPYILSVSIKQFSSKWYSIGSMEHSRFFSKLLKIIVKAFQKAALKIGIAKFRNKKVGNTREDNIRFIKKTRHSYGRDASCMLQIQESIPNFSLYI